MKGAQDLHYFLWIGHFLVNTKMSRNMKKANKFSALMVIAAAIICSTFMSAQDWPQYLGPNRDSTSPQKGLLRTWPENGPEVLWTADVGIGYGGPVIKDGKVYLVDRDRGADCAGRRKTPHP